MDIDTLSPGMLNYANMNYNEMFNICPLEYSEVIEKDKVLSRRRYHKSYMRTPVYNKELCKNNAYMFSGHNSDNNQELPAIFQPFLKFINDKYNTDYNQVTINWFKSGSDYIPIHKDYRNGIDEKCDIIIISLGDSRTFRVKKINNNNIKSNVDYNVKNGDIVKIDTHCLHGVPQIPDNDCQAKHSRISISFRRYL